MRSNLFMRAWNITIAVLMLAFSQPTVLLAAAGSKKTDQKTVAATKAVKSKKKSKAKTDSEAEEADKNSTKPLDLTIQINSADMTKMADEINPSFQSQKTSIFTKEETSKPAPVQLGGRLIMSPEPETEKQKSADGAGIVINVKP
jgi:hypothetical protein